MNAGIEADDTAFIVIAQSLTSKRRRTKMNVKSNVKPAGISTPGLNVSLNHNQTLLREAKKNLRVKSRVKAGLKIKLTD
jgi:hypothetical protein